MRRLLHTNCHDSRLDPDVCGSGPIRSEPERIMQPGVNPWIYQAVDLPGNDDQSHWTDKIGMSILQLFFQIK